MLAAALLSCLLAAPPPDRPTAEELHAYERARAAAGRDAAAHVRLALWCERHGLASRRLEHLALALMADPQHAAARGLMGLVRDADAWRRPEQVAERVGADAERAAALAEYNARRDRAEPTAEAQYQLALWCADHGLGPEATAHLTATVRLDPSHEAAWKKLGCRKHRGRWLSEEQIRASAAEADAQAKADRRWGPRLEKLRDQLRDPRRRAAAEAELSRIDDPRAVPSLWRVFAQGGAEDQARAAQALAQIDGMAASRALAALAVHAPSEEARRAASEALPWRDPREFMGPLIGLVRRSIAYEVKHVGGPGSPGELFIQGERANLHRVYATPNPADMARPGDFLLGYDADGQPVAGRVLGYNTQRLSLDQVTNPINSWAYDPLGWAGPDLSALPGFLAQTPLGAAGQQAAQQAVQNQRETLEIERGVLSTNTGRPGGGRAAFVDVTRPVVASVPVGQMLQEARQAAASAEQQLQADVAFLDRINAEISRVNERVLPILRTVAGQDFGEDQQEWARWWTEYQGYAFRGQSSVPTTVQQVIPPAYEPAMPPIQVGLGPVVEFRAGHSCFAAGTPVRTLEGPRSIESIRVGDQVLSQDVASGLLSFQPVVAVYHNPPDQTLRIGFEGPELAVVATPIHRFWRAGSGWTMARDLKPGDEVRTVGGVARVAAVEADRVQPVFNLEVARGRSFFVGASGLLVHDNSLVETVDRPFDAAPMLAQARGNGR